MKAQASLELLVAAAVLVATVSLLIQPLQKTSQFAGQQAEKTGKKAIETRAYGLCSLVFLNFNAIETSLETRALENSSVPCLVGNAFAVNNKILVQNGSRKWFPKE